jgi:hypothetical protein
VTDAPARDHARAWSFDELVREGGSLIPAYAPQWTNHNPSDPGITLLELLAYFSEILAYRAVRITPDAKLHFLGLLEGRAASLSDPLVGTPSSGIDKAIQARVEALSRVECAVTPGDFEQLAVDAAAAHLDGGPNLRAKCVPGLDLRGVVETQHPAVAGAVADVSIVLALKSELPSDVARGVCRHVQEALAPRCLLTTRAHVVRAPHLHVLVACRISPEPGVPLSVAADAVDAALQRRFDPMQSDEPFRDTQPFGCPLHLARVAGVIDRTEGVDYVENVIVLRMSIDGAIDDDRSLVGIRIGLVSRVGENTRLGGLASVGMRRLQTDYTGEAETVLVQPWELVHVRLARNGVQGIGDDGFALGAGGRHRG